MNGFTPLGTVLTVVFSVSILVLVLELIYVLWRKQVYRQRSDPEQGSDPYCMTPSKEQLLYFFCLKNASRVEPSGVTTTVSDPVDNELAKWQQHLYGPSRVLFTIKEEEEEREGTETETETENEATKSRVVFADDEASGADHDDQSLSNQLAEDEKEETTPFSTPCASRLYYTPSPSPSRDSHVLVC